MNIFEVILFYLLITKNLFYISRNFINSNSDEVDQLKTKQFIQTDADAAEIISKSVKKSNLMYFKNYKKKTLKHQEKVGQTLKPVKKSSKIWMKELNRYKNERRTRMS